MITSSKAEALVRVLLGAAMWSGTPSRSVALPGLIMLE